MSTFGLSQHFTEVFIMVGIMKYSKIFPNEVDALAALSQDTESLV